MSKEVQIKYSLDEDGEEYFPVTHVEGIIGLDEFDVRESTQSNFDEIMELKKKVEELEIKNNSQEIAINELVKAVEDLKQTNTPVEESDSK